MAKKIIGGDSAWIVFNTDIPVLTTLRGSRREAIDAWSGCDKQRWKKWQKAGAVEVKKVRLSFV